MAADSEQELFIGLAASNDIASVRALLEEGVDPNAELASSESALDVAATDEIKDLLRSYGAK